MLTMIFNIVLECVKLDNPFSELQGQKCNILLWFSNGTCDALEGY